MSSRQMKLEKRQKGHFTVVSFCGTFVITFSYQIFKQKAQKLLHENIQQCTNNSTYQFAKFSIITAHVRSTRTGNVLTRACLSVHKGVGYPHPVLMEGTHIQSQWGWYLHPVLTGGWGLPPSSPDWGYPISSPRWGYPLEWMWLAQVMLPTVHLLQFPRGRLSVIVNDYRLAYTQAAH